MVGAKTWVGFLGQGNPAQAFGNAPLFARLRFLLLPRIRSGGRGGAGAAGFAADLQVVTLKVGSHPLPSKWCEEVISGQCRQIEIYNTWCYINRVMAGALEA